MRYTDRDVREKHGTIKALVLTMACLATFCLVLLYGAVSKHPEAGGGLAYAVLGIAGLMAWAGYIDLRFSRRYEDLNDR